MLFKHLPDDFGFGRMIGMPQQIPEVDHPAPIDLRMRILNVIWNGPRGLANDLEEAFNKKPSSPICGKLIEAYASHDLVDFGNRFEDVTQSIFHGGRHSEDLNQIVGDPFGYARLQ